MATPTLDVADDIVDVLNSRVYDPEFTAVRQHSHDFDRANLELAVYVVPRSNTTTTIARNMIERAIEVDVIVIGPAATETVREELSSLCEDIKDDLRGEQHTGLDHWVFSPEISASDRNN